MKTTKNLFMVMLLLITTTTLFANVNPAKFKPAKKPITTSYTVHVNLTDDGPNGQFYGSIALHNYTVQTYVTDSSLSGISNAVTLSVNFTSYVNLTLTDNTGVDNKTIDSEYTILSGHSYSSEVDGAGGNFRVTINSATLSPTTLNGLPVYVDYTVHYTNY